jgi:hypothetical protein
MGKLDGSCLCGSVRLVCDAEPLAAANCHCKDCQRQTGSAFSTVVTVPADAVEVRGEVATFTTVGTDTGAKAHRQFCPACGSPVLTLPELTPGLAFIKAGILDDPSIVRPVMEAWTGSAQPWIEPDRQLVCTERGPSEEILAMLAG